MYNDWTPLFMFTGAQLLLAIVDIFYLLEQKIQSMKYTGKIIINTLWPNSEN